MKPLKLITFVAVLFCLILPQTVSARGKPQSLLVTPLQIATSTGVYSYDVELAVSQEERNIGLMFRHEMEQDHGMLFLNSQVSYSSFWMKNTYISLDIIFLKADGTVANIVAGTIPLSLDNVVSSEPVLAVLELNHGQAAKIGLKAGDQIYHLIFGNLPQE